MRFTPRSHLALLAAGLVSVGAAQTPAVKRDSLFQTVRPDATVVISEHPTGADLVEITVRRGDHPLPDLRAACERVGELTGVPVRGLVVTSTNPASPNGFPKATFATDGLVLPEDPRLRMTPILRAFGFGRTPLKNLALIYSDHVANAKTVRRYADEPGTLQIEAQRLPNGVEYRTTLSPTLKEEGVVLPGPKGSIETKRLAGKAATPSDYTLPVVLVVGALAAGGLVYSLLLRPRSGAARRPSGR